MTSNTRRASHGLTSFPGEDSDVREALSSSARVPVTVGCAPGRRYTGTGAKGACGRPLLSEGSPTAGQHGGPIPQVSIPGKSRLYFAGSEVAAGRSARMSYPRSRSFVCVSAPRDLEALTPGRVKPNRVRLPMQTNPDRDSQARICRVFTTFSRLAEVDRGGALFRGETTPPRVHEKESVWKR